MTPASTASTTLLQQFGLTTAAEELVPRRTRSGRGPRSLVLGGDLGDGRGHGEDDVEVLGG